MPATSQTRAAPADSPTRASVPFGARAASALLILALRSGPGLGLAAACTERAFARLGFCDVMVSPAARKAFVRNLLETVRTKLVRGDLRPMPVASWVARLLWSAWRMPRVAARFARRNGFEPPAFLIVSATERCNLECAHCYQQSSARAAASIDHETFDALLRRQRSEWGAALVVVTGGEPLLYSTDRGDLFTLAREHASTLFVVYTNGTRITDTVARRLVELGNVVPLVSVEGEEDETAAVRGPEAWPAATRAMRRLRAQGALFGVSLTAGRANAALLETPAFYRRLRDEHGATFFWVLERAPLGRGAADRDLLSLDEKTRLQAALLECVTQHGFLLTSFLHAPGAFSGCLGAGRADSFFFVDARAEIRHCVYSPLRLGNARELLARGEPLSSFLSKSPAQALRRAQRSFFAAGGVGEGGAHRPCPVLSNGGVPPAP